MGGFKMGNWYKRLAYKIGYFCGWARYGSLKWIWYGYKHTCLITWVAVSGVFLWFFTFAYEDQCLSAFNHHGFELWLLWLTFPGFVGLILKLIFVLMDGEK